jgi:nucleotide-binding universal stress UspA family protein
MATHGRGNIGRLVFGSVTDKVVRGATTPVVAVRVVAGADDAAAPTLNTIVVALDGSTLSEGALPLAAALARGVGATLHLVRVIEPFWRSTYASVAPEAVYLGEAQVAALEERAESDARAYLDQMASTLRSSGLRVVWETRFGRPAEELARGIETSGADLVVMATHGRGGLSRWALGSVTSELLQRGIAPVMVVRPLAAEPVTKPEPLPRRVTVTAAGSGR